MSEEVQDSASYPQSMEERTGQVVNTMIGDINSLLGNVPELPRRLSKPQTIQNALSDIIASQRYTVIQSPQPAQRTSLDLASPSPPPPQKPAPMIQSLQPSQPTPLDLTSREPTMTYPTASQKPAPMTTQLFSGILGDADLSKKPVPIQRIKIKKPELTPVPGKVPLFLESPTIPDTHVIVEKQFLTNMLNTYQNRSVSIQKDEEIEELKQKLKASNREVESLKAKLQEVLEERRSDKNEEEDNEIRSFCRGQIEGLGKEAYVKILAQYEDISNKTLEIYNRGPNMKFLEENSAIPPAQKRPAPSCSDEISQKVFRPCHAHSILKKLRSVISFSTQPISIAMSDRGCNYYKVDPAAFLKGLRSTTTVTQEELKAEANQGNNHAEPTPAPQPEAPPAPQNAAIFFQAIMMPMPPMLGTMQLLQVLSDRFEAAEGMGARMDLRNASNQPTASGEAPGDNDTGGSTNGNNQV